MISVDEALTHVLLHARDFGDERISLLQAGGRVLAEDVSADRDFPPFDRVMMDGIAISSKAFDAGCRTFPIAGIQPAGSPQTVLEGETRCIEVMTGAVMPEGTDAVVPYEECELRNGVATVTAAVVRRRQHIHRRGSDVGKHTVLFSCGVRISPAMIGVIASVGLPAISVRRLPKVAVCSTGDELVEVGACPEPHQIRRSNSYMIAAALAAEGIRADCYHLPDEKSGMTDLLEDIIGGHDVLLFSGAVSKGRYDFLPEVLAGRGMETIFHRVAQKPGKPLLFGKFRDGKIVFGFPGNPSSTLVCYAFYFRSWLSASLGSSPDAISAQLAEDVDFAPALGYHLLVSLRTANGVLLATPFSGANSGDMISLHRANAIMTLPAGESHFRKGAAYPLTLLLPF